MKFVKKPIEIEAWPAHWINAQASHNWDGLPESIREAYEKGGWVFGALVNDERGIYIPTLEGSMFAHPTDWIIRGVKGEFYPCKPDIFAATYTEVK